MRKMRNLDNMILIHYFLVFGVFYSSAMLWVLGVKLETPTEPDFIFCMLGCAFFALVGQVFLAKGFQTVKAGIASVMRYFDVVFVMCLDAVVLGETINIRLAPCFPFSPLLSSSSMFLAVLTSLFQKLALHPLLVQRKTFLVHLRTTFLSASFGFLNLTISTISFASFVDNRSFCRMPTSSSFLFILVNRRACLRR
ncbi:hypothetical protein BBJ29_008349 [Phytophthora kernoviae]|uniref:EamA domain-containing protein n=1 Tax=Phytophthora kernoviae TaxID=325452 RepID=A0A3F2RH91_9STRA|nr:hypothetical protein BBJ29_008349 [Phytophthora kernoviae]RLN56911.1 hypothetical protein BBP00_00007762 [Phytophthora kernoviae]